MALQNIQSYEEEEDFERLEHSKYFLPDIDDEWCWPVITKANMEIEEETGMFLLIYSLNR